MRTPRVLAGLAAAALALPLAATSTAPLAGAAPATPTTPDAVKACGNDPRGPGPKMMTYFRTWRDTATDPTVNKTTMADLPCGVDVAFVFPAYTPPENDFWTKLADEYVPSLHQQGTLVVQTTGWHALVNPEFSDDQAGYQALAQHIYDTKVAAYGLDGLDVDLESTLVPGTEDYRRFVGTFTALSKLMGPQSGTDKLLILDTNKPGTEPVFAEVTPMIDYLLEQSYGRSLSGLQATRDSFKAILPPEKYLIGFSFYEERGHNWGDTTEPMDQSRAWAYAQWQPEGETKGGIFSYAVDRDGVPIGDDAIQPTDYSWTKALTAEMERLRTDRPRCREHGVAPALPQVPNDPPCGAR